MSGFSEQDVMVEAGRLDRVVRALPLVMSAFRQAARGDYTSPEVSSVLENAQHLKKEGTIDRLRALSQERADIVLDEMQGSLDIAERGMDRVRLLLRDRKPVYGDEHIQACQEDIFDHLGYDSSHLDEYAGKLKPEERVRQVGFHLARVSGFAAAVSSYAVKDMQRDLSGAQDRAAIIKVDQDKVSHGIAHVTKHGAMTPEDVEAFYAYAPPLPSDVRQGFGKTSFDLGVSHVCIAESALARLRNTIAYLHLIDNDLKPANIGNPADWDQQRQHMVAEGEGTITQTVDFLERSQKYLKQSSYFVSDPDMEPS